MTAPVAGVIKMGSIFEPDSPGYAGIDFVTSGGLADTALYYGFLETAYFDLHGVLATYQFFWLQYLLDCESEGVTIDYIVDGSNDASQYLSLTYEDLHDTEGQVLRVHKKIARAGRGIGFRIQTSSQHLSNDFRLYGIDVSADTRVGFK